VKQGGQAMRWNVAILVGVGLLAAPGAVPAAESEVLILGDEAGVDSAPYKFLPSSVRGNGEWLWAITDPGTDTSPPNVHNFETYFRFALPPELLSGELVAEEAVLSVFFARDDVSFGDGTDEPGILECRPVLEAWDVLKMNWDNKPDSGAPVDVITGITELGSLSCDVTELVQDWASGATPNHGIALTNPTGKLLGFPSFESVDDDPATEPQLVVLAVPEPSAQAAALAAVAGLAALAAWRRRHQRARTDPSRIC